MQTFTAVQNPFTRAENLTRSQMTANALTQSQLDVDQRIRSFKERCERYYEEELGEIDVADGRNPQ